MYLSRFTKFVIIPQNILGVIGLVYLVYYQLWWWLLATYVSWVIIGVFGVSLAGIKPRQINAVRLRRQLEQNATRYEHFIEDANDIVRLVHKRVEDRVVVVPHAM